jgi:ClpP class serine protease
MTEPQRPVARFVKPGELLAMDPKKIHSGPQGFFWLFGGGDTPNERKGDITIVHIRGELEHHDEGYGTSYEGILKKLRSAITGQDASEEHERQHKYDEDYQPLDATPPKSIVIAIDSPGGVVSGLNETVKAIQKLRKENPQVKVVAYVNEMAASAAYALACSCEEILCPPSAILGSIGVISTMISQAEKNKRDGYDVRLLTSGARKADGHVHAPLSDAAINVEQSRVDKLAKAFFTLAGKARGIPIATIEGFQAGIYLGKEAVSRKLADAVMSFDDVLLGLSNEGPDGGAKAGGNVTDRRLGGVSIRPQSAEAAQMPIALDALIKKTEAALATETDPKKLLSLAASLQAYKKTKKHVEHTETEEAPDDGDDEDKDDEDKDGDTDEESKNAKGKEEEEASSAAKPPMDEEEEEEESEEKAAKAALALVQNITGMKGKKALGALQAIAATAANTAQDVALLKKAQLGQQKSALIEKNTGKFLTKKEAAWLSGQKLSTVQGFVEMRQKAGVIVNTDESTLIRPKQAVPGTEESLPAETIALIDNACHAVPEGQGRTNLRETLVKNHLAAHNKQLTAALNGVGRI